MWFEDRDRLDLNDTCDASIWLLSPEFVIPRLKIGDVFGFWCGGRVAEGEITWVRSLGTSGIAEPG